MLATLVVFSYLTSLLCSSHLLGAFVAGMCFVGVGRSRQVRWPTLARAQLTHTQVLRSFPT